MDDSYCQDDCTWNYDPDLWCEESLGKNIEDAVEDAVEGFVERYVDEEAVEAWLEDTEASWTEMADRHEQEKAA